LNEKPETLVSLNGQYALCRSILHCPPCELGTKLVIGCVWIRRHDRSHQLCIYTSHVRTLRAASMTPIGPMEKYVAQFIGSYM
jgi:hypothetical protein